MTVYSWNMLFRNPDLRGALDFIRNADADVFCLQEVPERFLPELEALPFHHAKAVDVQRLSEDPQTLYLVVLSRYPIRASASIPYPDYWERLPLYAKAMFYALHPLHFSRSGDRNGMYADLETPTGVMRAFNLHLALANPRVRKEEFECAMLQHDRMVPTVVCGDFNIIEYFPIALLNWMLGGSLGDWILYPRERAHIEAAFSAHGLTNPLRGRVTHPFGKSQLDHVLHSPHFRVNRAQALADSHGSDHLPVRAELDYI